MDNIAQELNETFELTLQLSSIDQFGTGVNLRDRLEGVIIDSDGKFYYCTILITSFIICSTTDRNFL